MCLLFIHEQPPQTHTDTHCFGEGCVHSICCQHIDVLVLTRMHNRTHTGPEELRSIEKRHREQLGCVASRTSYLCSSAAPLFSPPATSFWHMLQMQSQIKVSVALMNKRAHPICASCRKRFNSVSERKAKQTTHGVAGTANALLWPRVHMGWPNPENLPFLSLTLSLCSRCQNRFDCENTWKTSSWFNEDNNGAI